MAALKKTAEENNQRFLKALKEKEEKHMAEMARMNE